MLILQTVCIVILNLYVLYPKSVESTITGIKCNAPIERLGNRAIVPYLKNGVIFMQMIDLENIDEQIEQVRQTSKLKFCVEPRAMKAYYSSTENTIAIHLNTGAIFIIPINHVQWLNGADRKLLAKVEVTPLGDGLHWEELDIDLSIPGLLSGKFGDAQWMTKLVSESLEI